jgi:hypothetical protein
MAMPTCGSAHGTLGTSRTVVSVDASDDAGDDTFATATLADVEKAR